MLFKIYIGTIAFFYIGFFVYLIDATIKVKSSGIDKSDAKKIPEFRYYVQIIIYSLIPLFNVFMGFFYIFSKDLYKSVDEKIDKARKNQN